MITPGTFRQTDTAKTKAVTELAIQNHVSATDIAVTTANTLSAKEEGSVNSARRMKHRGAMVAN